MSAEDRALAAFAQNPADSSEREQELLQALLQKYAEQRGEGQDSKWAVIAQEFNRHAVSQKSEASVRRMARKAAQQARAADEVLAHFHQAPAGSAEDEEQLLRILVQKYSEQRGAGEDAKWAVIAREFNRRAVESLQRSPAALRRAAKKLSADAAKQGPPCAGAGGSRGSSTPRSQESKGAAPAAPGAGAQRRPPCAGGGSDSGSSPSGGQYSRLPDKERIKTARSGFENQPGPRIALVGRTGAGKSTFVNALLGPSSQRP